MSDFSAIEQLASQGKKIQAIKEFRNVTRVGLKDAKEAVEWFQSHGQWPAQYREPDPEPASSPDGRFAQAEQFVARGKKIHAIKEFRTAVPGVGLKEAKEAVEWFQSHGRWPDQYGQAPSPTANDPEEPEEHTPLDAVEQFMKQGKKIHAIKELRSLTGWGLKDSKMAVDRYQAKGRWPQELLDTVGGGSPSPAPSPAPAPSPPSPSPSPSPAPAAATASDPELAAALAVLQQHLGRPPDVRLAVRAQRVPYEGYLVMLGDRANFVRKDRGQWMLDPVVPVFWYPQITAVELDYSLGTDLHISMGHIHEWLSGMEPSDAEAAQALFSVVAP